MGKRGRECEGGGKSFRSLQLRKTYSNLKFPLDFPLVEKYLQKVSTTSTVATRSPNPLPPPSHCSLPLPRLHFAKTAQRGTFHTCARREKEIGREREGDSYTYICMCLQLAGAKPRCRHAPKIVSAWIHLHPDQLQALLPSLSLSFSPSLSLLLAQRACCAGKMAKCIRIFTNALH